ncbi:hypothetical protein [Caulobacter sp.]|uniref:hypothetical protein n=1 Tax=Caulobacter sp. TaxID=78 RepID=UPI001B158559|nr:hypothetical protein [Caulobacter sp.]MBO9546976.1 hypothetical protein [Caulobacter sp.]
MTFSHLEKRVVTVLFKLSMATGVLGCLGFVTAFFLPHAIGPRVMDACGCIIAMDLVAMLYLLVFDAVIMGAEKGRGG